MVFRAGLDRRAAGGAADRASGSTHSSRRSAASRTLSSARCRRATAVSRREVLAINMVMAGCKPEYAPVVRAAMLALTAKAFNLNGVQATTHMAAPLLIVNGPVARAIGMNGGCNAFGSGNRANATIGRALRLVLLNVGGGRPGDLDKSTLGHPGKYTYCVAENEAESPWAPYHVEKGFAPGEFDGLCHRRRAAAQRHQPCRQRPRGHPRQHLFGDEHDRQQQRGVERALRGRHRPRACAHDRRQRAGPGTTCAATCTCNAYNLFSELTFNERYGKIYNRNLPRWYKRDQDRASRSCRSRPHPSVCDRRRGRPVFGLYPRLGPHVVAGAARRSKMPAARAATGLRRRHLLSVSGGASEGMLLLSTVSPAQAGIQGNG